MIAPASLSRPRRPAPRLLAILACLAVLLAALAPRAPAAAAAQTPPPVAAPAQPAAPPPPPAPLPPGTALYDVEIVIFSATTLAPPEDWNSAPTPRGFGSPSNQATVPPQVVRLLGPSDYRLNGVVDGLRRSGSWQPIAHAAWIQNAPNWGSHLGITLDGVGISVPGLSGSVFLERAPLYVHLGFNVQLQQGAQSYSIDEMHNVRLNEKEYFDHPSFGIIAVVTALKVPGR